MNKREWPAWKEPESYPDENDLTPQEWAWQFLRRNPKYQSDWEHEAAVRSAETGIPLDAISMDEIIPGVSRRSKGRKYFLYRYGLYTLPRPKVCFPQHLTFEPRYGEIYYHDKPNFKKADLNPLKGQVFIGFDPTVPTKPQLEVAEKKLKELREIEGIKVKKTQKRPIEWLRYIRLLDAKKAGANLKEMADYFFPSQENATQNVAMNLRRAKEMLDKDYRFLPFGWC